MADTTHHRTQTAAQLVVAAALALALAVASAGCARHEPGPPTTSQPTTNPLAAADIDDRFPDDVLLEVARRVYTWDPADDRSPAAGFDRARPLLDPGYIASVGPTAAGLAQITGATWQRWTDQRSRVEATARIGADDHPPDTPTTRQRVVLITQRVTAEPERTVIAYMIASKAPGTDRWRVSMIAPRGATP